MDLSTSGSRAIHFQSVWVTLGFSSGISRGLRGSVSKYQKRLVDDKGNVSDMFIWRYSLFILSFHSIENRDSFHKVLLQ